MSDKNIKKPSISLLSVDSPFSLADGKSYLPMAHGKATDEMAKMNSKNAEIDIVAGDATMQKNGVTLVLNKFNDLQGAMNIGTHKLLSVAIAEFTKKNTHGVTTNLDYEVSIPFDDFIYNRGYDILERETNTPEEAEAEKKRIKNLKKEARKTVGKELDVLHAAEISWKEKVKGQDGDFMNVSIIGTRGIKSGRIYMAFDPIMAKYLVQLPITQYPIALLRADGRNSNAYGIGLKMAEYFNLDRNIVQGREDRLAVATLLACTNLPTYEAVCASRKSWEERIKEPFENALDELTACGVLSDWKYVKAKAKPLKEDEAANITDYHTFESLYIQFDLPDALDHTRRIEANIEKAKEKAKKKASKKKG